MSSGCGDVLSLVDLQTAKKHQIFEAEVITGKSGGVAGGADIDYATNAVTGQSQKTLPAVLRDAGFSPVSWDFSTGGTLTVNDRDKAVYDPVSKTWYSYAGTLPVTVPAGFNPVGNADWKPQTDPDLREELASHDAGKGDTLVGVKQPFTGAVGMTQHDKNKQLVHVADFGAVADGVTDAAPGINAAVAWLKANGGGELRFDTGTYLCGTAIDLTGVNIGLKGAGQYSTTLKANFTGDVFINLYETTDARISPVAISDMFIDGNSTIGRVMSVRYRHYAKFTNVTFSGGTESAMYAIDAWLNTYINCGFESSNYGMYLAGSNHRTAVHSCSYQGNTARNLIVRSAGTAADGNSALYFTNCDFEFAAALGIDFQGTDLTLNCCYLGENLEGSVLQIYSGIVRITGGTCFFGHTANTYLAYMSGGTLIADGVVINGQTHASIPLLAASAGGKVAFRNCQFNFPLGGSATMAGDVLLALNDKKVFAPRLGIDYTGYGYNATVTDTTSGSARTITALTVPGPSPIIGCRGTLTDMQWRDGEPWAVVVTYSSNIDLSLRVASEPLGSGTVIGVLPTTGGAVRTAVLYTTTATRTTATVLEIYRDTTVAVGHSFTLYDVSFGDSRALGTDFGGNGGNIYKF